MRISDWSSDVCSSDLLTRQRHEMFARHLHALWRQAPKRFRPVQPLELIPRRKAGLACPSPGEQGEQKRIAGDLAAARRVLAIVGEDGLNQLRKIGRAHVELQSLMRISYAVF